MKISFIVIFTFGFLLMLACAQKTNNSKNVGNGVAKKDRSKRTIGLIFGSLVKGLIFKEAVLQLLVNATANITTPAPTQMPGQMSSQRPPSSPASRPGQQQQQPPLPPRRGNQRNGRPPVATQPPPDDTDDSTEDSTTSEEDDQGSTAAMGEEETTLINDPGVQPNNNYISSNFFADDDEGPNRITLNHFFSRGDHNDQSPVKSYVKMNGYQFTNYHDQNHQPQYQHQLQHHQQQHQHQISGKYGPQKLHSAELRHYFDQSYQPYEIDYDHYYYKK